MPPLPAENRLQLPLPARPLVALAALLAIATALTPGFYTVEIRDGALYGALIDVLHHGSKVVILAMGMTLVVATRGVDLSVGAVAAIAGAIAATLAARGEGLGLVVAAAVGAAAAAGALNGVLVAVLRIQPIVATLVLMVCGRGVAQLIAGGQIITFEHPGLAFLGSGRALGLPAPAVLAASVAGATVILVRLTALGLFIEAAGGSPAAARAAGVRTGPLLVGVYTFSGVCAGVAGLVIAADIKAADSNHAGLFLELDAILAVVLGGTALTGGRFFVLGSAAGALLIQAMTTALYMNNVSPDIAPVPKAVVVIGACLLLSPVLRGRVRLGRRRSSLGGTS